VPVATAPDLLNFVRNRIAALLRTPEMWTWGPLDAVELQVLQLLEVAHVAAGSTPDCAKAVPRRYWEHLEASKLPGYNRTLAGRLGLSQEPDDAFVRILNSFVTREWKLMTAATRTGAGLPIRPVEFVQPLYDVNGDVHYAAGGV